MRVPLIILAAVLGAGLAAIAPTACAQAQVVATVNGKPISEADLRLAEREVAVGTNLAPEERRRLLVEYLIQRQLFAAAGEQEGLGAGEEFDTRLAYAKQGLLHQLFLEKQAKEGTTEADARRLYDEQVPLIQSQEEIRVRHILVESEAVAKVVHGEIVGGADFATLAKALSTDSNTAQRGGDLGWRAKGELPDKLATATFALKKKGDLSPPIETKAGWHVLQLENRRERTVPEFAALKNHIIRILVRSKTQELVRRLREKATIVYLDAALKPADAVSPVASTPANPTGATALMEMPRQTAAQNPSPSSSPNAASVKGIFEKYHLLGTFAVDCIKPPGGDNWYYVHHAIDSDHVQRDFMSGPTSRSWFAIFDRASENGAGEIFVSGQMTGHFYEKELKNQMIDGVLRIGPNLMKTWESTVSGQKTVSAGRQLSTGKEMPWLKKCARD
jgi:peptidyl-prolyl cis-trans isomerase C